MSTTANTPKSGQLEASIRKVFSRGSDDVPLPVYTNAVDFAMLGMDVFMDVGVASPESVQATATARESNPATARTVDVNVLYRFGMSLQTVMQLHKNLTQIIEAAKTQAQAAVEAQKAQRREDA